MSYKIPSSVPEVRRLHKTANFAKWTFQFGQTNLFCPQCLKITEKVSFNVASEASYVYTCGETGIPDRSILIGEIFMKSAKIEKLK